MPVVRLPDDEVVVSRFSRLSASQVAKWRTCPRIWWYEAHLKMKAPLPPVIARGNAVEACVCRVLRESPVLIDADAADRVLISPLDEEGRVALDCSDGWIGPTIEPLDRESWPSDLDTLAAWAHARIDAHFDRCFEEAVDDWLSLSNRVGDAADLDRESARRMAHVAIDLQLEEVVHCMQIDGGPNLTEWRSGDRRDEWPPPDGFPRERHGPPLEAETGGDVTYVEAWAITRPWFVDPDAKPFTETTLHPDQWFQGEYDLIHDWDGTTRIVDLKASVGEGDRSTDYVNQLRTYAWLWWRRHPNQPVDGLEIWYLGAPESGGTARKLVEAPTEDEMRVMEEDLRTLYEKLHGGGIDEAGCPPRPRTIQPHDAGGIPKGDPQPSEKRCGACAHRSLCEATDHDANLPDHQTVQHLGLEHAVSPIATLDPRCTVLGTVFSIRGPSFDEDGAVDFDFELRQGVDSATVKRAWGSNPRRIWRGLAKDAEVRVVNGIARVWRGRLEIEIDDRSVIERADGPSDDDEEIIDIHTRTNVVGRVWSVDAVRGRLPNGETSTRWSVTLVDESGIGGLVAFKSFVPSTAPSVERGDWIAVVNGEIGEFAGRPQVRFGPGTSLLHLRDAHDLPPW